MTYFEVQSDCEWMTRSKHLHSNHLKEDSNPYSLQYKPRALTTQLPLQIRISLYSNSRIKMMRKFNTLFYACAETTDLTVSLTNLFVKNNVYCQNKNSLKSCEDGKQVAKGRHSVINWQHSKEQTNAHQHQQNTSSTYFIPEKSPIQNA